MYTKLQAKNNGYELDSFGHIKNPGKFEGEHYSILYFYEGYLNGGDTVMELTEEEKAEYGINANFVYLAESNDGFLSLEFYDTREEAEKRDIEDFITYDIDLNEGWDE